VKRLISALALAAVSTLAIGIVPASATPLPVVYTNGMGGNWSFPAVRPAEIGFGANWDEAGIHWTHWTVRSAYGTGTYYLCRGCHYYRANIALTVVRNHNGRPYFAEATIIATGHPTVHLWYFYERTGPWAGYWWHP